MLASLVRWGWLRLLVSSVVCASSLLGHWSRASSPLRGSLCRGPSSPSAHTMQSVPVWMCPVHGASLFLFFRVFALSTNPVILALPVLVGRFAVRIPSWSLSLRWSVRKFEDDSNLKIWSRRGGGGRTCAQELSHCPPGLLLAAGAVLRRCVDFAHSGVIRLQILWSMQCLRLFHRLCNPLSSASWSASETLQTWTSYNHERNRWRRPCSKWSACWRSAGSSAELDGCASIAWGHHALTWKRRWCPLWERGRHQQSSNDAMLCWPTSVGW